jgi:hypothetical protein
MRVQAASSAKARTTNEERMRMPLPVPIVLALARFSAKLIARKAPIPRYPGASPPEDQS